MFENTKFFLGNFLEPFVDLFAWGILERHPKLRIVMAEAGTGWLPWLVQELDYRHWRLWEAKEFWADKGGSALVTKPSELFRRQIYATFQEDYVALSLLPFFGEGHLLWASDYPHPDSVWPNSRAAIERQMRSTDAGDAPRADPRQCRGVVRAGVTRYACHTGGGAMHVAASPQCRLGDRSDQRKRGSRHRGCDQRGSRSARRSGNLNRRDAGGVAHPWPAAQSTEDLYAKAVMKLVL